MASKIQKHRRREVAAPAVVTDKIPLVSVIIPMYNSAKFITQTLESLAYQTMKDFEVVVVDDCSTDNSVEVVEAFKNLWGGGINLHIIKLPKNTGTPGLPRNVGIQFARGKYIAFLDSDDLYTQTALEELTTLAEKYLADVVRLGSCFKLWNGQGKIESDPAFTDTNEITNPKNFSVWSCFKEKLTEPTPEPSDIGGRVRRWLNSDANGFWSTCFMFYRRDFIIANQIIFSAMPACEDMPFAFEALCLAKRYLNAPNITYIVRPRIGSASKNDIAWQQMNGEFFAKRLRILKEGFRTLERIMDKVTFFANRPDYRYAILEWFANHRISITLGTYTQVSPFALNEIVKKEFHSADAALAAYLFNTVNIHRLQLMKMQQENIALRNELKKYQTAQ